MGGILSMQLVGSDQRVAWEVNQDRRSLEPISGPLAEDVQRALKTGAPVTRWKKDHLLSITAVTMRGERCALLIRFDTRRTNLTVRRATEFMTFVGSAILIIGFVFSLRVSRSISAPIQHLAEEAEEIGKGNLDRRVPDEKASREVRVLATAFNKMVVSLKEHIENLRQTTAAKEHMESELKIAAEVQQSILPKAFPPFPNCPQVEAHAIMIPAKQVGGDFYDCFFIDDDRMAFVIADVCGKGMPAALFMMTSRTLLKAEALLGFPAGQCLKRVNALLSADNSADMFVTLFYGILNVRTGKLEFSNAGHNGPYILRARGNLECLEQRGGTALGVLPDASYDAGEVTLAPGDALFLYTDGVTEARDKDEAFYSETRLVAALERIPCGSAKDLTRTLVEDVKTFASGAEQSDDITVLVVRRLPCA
jgi:sigma-B regulation protein RsbU (phosphoserine phosphatase)